MDLNNAQKEGLNFLLLSGIKGRSNYEEFLTSYYSTVTREMGVTRDGTSPFFTVINVTRE